MIHIGKNSTFHAWPKHIDMRYHWLRDALNDNLFELEKINIDYNGYDMLTKTLSREKLEVYCSIAEMATPSHSQKGKDSLASFLSCKAYHPT